MMRAYFSGSSTKVLQSSPDEILGVLVRRHPFPDDQEQKWAWIYEIEHVKQIARDHPGAYFFLEFSIPRMGKRADAVILYRGITGEAGLDGWLSALHSGYVNWQIHVSDRLVGDQLAFGKEN